MRYAIVSGGIVVNAVEAGADFAALQGWVELPDGYGPGDLYDGSEFTHPDPVEPAAPIPRPYLACLANLHVDGGDVSGISGESGLSFAFMIDTDVVWAFFANPMLNDAYGWNVTSSSGAAKITSRQTDYVEITVTGATEPYDLSLQIYTVN